MKNLKEIETEFKDNKLKLAVLEVIKEYKNKGYEKPTDLIADVLKGGCISGILGEFTYYADTTNFYNKYEGEIFDLIAEESENSGNESIYDFMNSLTGSAGVCDIETHKNLLVWFVVERITQEINDFMESD